MGIRLCRGRFKRRGSSGIFFKESGGRVQLGNLNGGRGGPLGSVPAMDYVIHRSMSNLDVDLSLGVCAF